MHVAAAARAWGSWMTLVTDEPTSTDETPGAPTFAPRVLLVEDHPAVRAGIRLQLEARGLEIVGEAADGGEALTMIRQAAPSVVMADLRMPGIDGMQLVELIRDERLDVAVVLLSAVTEAHLVQRALDLGARGYVSKDAPIETIVAAVNAVAAGGRYVDPMLLASMLDTPSETLSVRELEVLQQAANGMQNKVIAMELGISEETVKTHLSNVMRKLDSASRTQAVAAGLRRALII